MKQLLSDNKIKSLKPKDKAYKTADGAGLYVYTSKSGAKSFRYDFKLHDKWATITYGMYPDMSLAEARGIHQETRKQVLQGIDPRLALRADNQLKPFSFYAHEKIKTSKLADRTAKKKLQVMEKYLFEYLDKRPVNEITTVELLNLVKPIALDGKIETARRLATYARQVFNDLIALQLISNNPADRLGELLPPIPEATNLSHTTNPEEIAIMLRAFDSYQGDFAVKQALCFAPHVFLRPQNIRMMQWEWVDFTNRIITIPQDFMKMSRPIN